MTDVEPLTKDEIRNGWTLEKKAAYFAERKKAQEGFIARDPAFRQPSRPTQGVGYRPLRWRR